MTEQPFYTAKGRLTRYGLACGYIEQTWINTTHISLWMEHNTFHVQSVDHANDANRWKCWQTLTEARQDFDNAVRTVRQRDVTTEPTQGVLK